MSLNKFAPYNNRLKEDCRTAFAWLHTIWSWCGQFTLLVDCRCWSMSVQMENSMLQQMRHCHHDGILAVSVVLDDAEEAMASAIIMIMDWPSASMVKHSFYTLRWFEVCWKFVFAKDYTKTRCMDQEWTGRMLTLHVSELNGTYYF